MTVEPDAALGLEARAAGDDHLSLKLWLRLLACSTQIESEVRRRLRREFGTTLARFDYLAQLHRHPHGLAMSVLSRCLMVTGGSITGLTDQLELDGLVLRETVREDRRSSRLKLTPLGRERFEHMAQAHEAWVIEQFAGLNGADRKTLYALLGRLRRSAEPTAATEPEPGDTR